MYTESGLDHGDDQHKIDIYDGGEHTMIEEAATSALQVVVYDDRGCLTALIFFRFLSFRLTLIDQERREGSCWCDRSWCSGAIDSMKT